MTHEEMKAHSISLVTQRMICILVVTVINPLKKKKPKRTQKPPKLETPKFWRLKPQSPPSSSTD